MLGVDSRGQAIVEMAIVIFLLVLLVMGIFEFGRAMYIKNTLTHAARTGARAAVVTPSIANTDSPVPPVADCNYGANPAGNNKVYEAVCKSLFNMNSIEKSNIGMSISGVTGPSPGDIIKVSVTLNNYSWLFLPKLTKPGFYPAALVGETAMRYE